MLGEQEPKVRAPVGRDLHACVCYSALLKATTPPDDLMEAAAYHCPEPRLLQHLVERGASELGKALFLAARSGVAINVQWLLEHGAPIDFKTTVSTTQPTTAMCTRACLHNTSGRPDTVKVFCMCV